jgi:PhnB protein
MLPMSQVKKIPNGFHSITPYLNIKNCAQAIEFYKKAFDAKEKFRMATPDGKAIAHAEIQIGDSLLMMADEMPQMHNKSPTTLGGTSGGIFLYVEDVDKTFNQAVAEGAKVLDPIKDQFWGDRHGAIEDPFGHVWSISTHIRNVSPEELKKGAEEDFSRMCNDDNKTD